MLMHFVTIPISNIWHLKHSSTQPQIHTQSTHRRAWQIHRTSTFLWGYCFRGARPRQHQRLCSVRRDFTVHHISEHLRGLLSLEAASGCTWVITIGIDLNKTRSTCVNSAWCLAVSCLKAAENFVMEISSVEWKAGDTVKYDGIFWTEFFVILLRTQV